VHRFSRIAVFAILTLSLGACGSSPGASGDTGTESQPADASEPVADATTDGGGGGSGGGDIPTIADAMYMTGSVHVEVSGDKSQTVDAELVGGASGTFSGQTILTYIVGEGQEAVTVGISVSAESGATIAFSSAVLVAGGGADQGCSFGLDKNDAAGIAGTMSCSGVEGLTTGLETPIVKIEAAFSANR